MLRKKHLDVSLLSISLHHVDITIKGLGVQEMWRFTKYIATWKITISLRLAILSVIFRINPISLGWWRVILMKHFTTWIRKEELINHKLSLIPSVMPSIHIASMIWASRAWWNRRNGDQSVEERLDRYSATIE